MKITREGYYRLLRADGTQVSQHSYEEEAFERAQNTGPGQYAVMPPVKHISVTEGAAEAPPAEEPPVEDPPADPEPDPAPDPVPVGEMVIDYSYVDKSSDAYASFIALVENQLAGGNNYGFLIQDAAVAYKLAGKEAYRQLALQLAERQVADAEAAIADGYKPEVAGDSYLQIGPMLVGLAMAYAWCAPTASQRTRWKAYADQAIHNVWFFDDAKWGNKAWPGNGWGANDPGNNYFYSFCTATVHWALASQNEELLDYLRDDRFALLAGYFDNLAGGGSREGTGYGLSAREVFDFMATWRDSGYAVPASILRHARDSVRFWVHATMPSRARYAPIGDLARESVPYLMEYHRELMMRAAWLAGDDATEKLAGYWASTITQTPDYNRTWARRNALFAPAQGGGNPGAKLYFAEGTGNLFARSGWGADDTAVHVIAGPFDQSHAHEEQGGFTLFGRGVFLAVTANIASRSGINQSVTAHNVLRFEKAGTVLRQRRTEGGGAALAIVPLTDGFTAQADLKPVYPGSDVAAYKRSFAFGGGSLEVTDEFQTSNGTTAVFQVCTPVKPVIAGNVATAGNLKVTVLEPAGASLSVNADPNAGDVGQVSYRLDVAGGATRYRVRMEPA